IGGAYSEAAFRAVAWNGRFLVVGFASGTIPKLPLNLPLLKGASLVGVFWGGFAMGNPLANIENTQVLMDWYKKGMLKPHIHRIYDIEDTPKALEAMMNRKVRGKLVVQME
ncbi:MAG: zinc-binding dehydrogenase, partial [Maribacter sp.]|nr:zinc-binding dehydrogenase [Maribacter sp.]